VKPGSRQWPRDWARREGAVGRGRGRGGERGGQRPGRWARPRWGSIDGSGRSVVASHHEVGVVRGFWLPWGCWTQRTSPLEREEPLVFSLPRTPRGGSKSSGWRSNAASAGQIGPRRVRILRFSYRCHTPPTRLTAKRHGIYGGCSRDAVFVAPHTMLPCSSRSSAVTTVG
jgi:hypothetical protein